MTRLQELGMYREAWYTVVQGLQRVRHDWATELNDQITERNNLTVLSHVAVINVSFIVNLPAVTCIEKSKTKSNHTTTPLKIPLDSTSCSRTPMNLSLFPTIWLILPPLQCYTCTSSRTPFLILPPDLFPPFFSQPEVNLSTCWKCLSYSAWLNHHVLHGMSPFPLPISRKHLGSLLCLTAPHILWLHLKWLITCILYIRPLKWSESHSVMSDSCNSMNYTVREIL